MSVDRRTDISEFVEDITLTVSPKDFKTSAGYAAQVTGSVGVNTPNPAFGTFQISDVAVRTIGSNSAQGSLDTTTWQQYAGNTTNTLAAFGLAQFYREGSRIYLDGRVQLKSGQSYTLINDVIATLPPNFRPIKRETFICSCRFSGGPGVADGSPSGPGDTGADWRVCTLQIDNDGDITIVHVGAPATGSASNSGTTNNIDGFESVRDLVENGSSGHNWLSFSGTNFRCIGSY